MMQHNLFGTSDTIFTIYARFGGNNPGSPAGKARKQLPRTDDGNYHQERSNDPHYEAFLTISTLLTSSWSQ
jgi:hypothetical protein